MRSAQSEITPWVRYIRAIGRGGTSAAYQARLCQIIGGKTAGEARRNVTRRAKTRAIDAQTAAAQLRAIDDIAEMQARGAQTHTIEIKHGQWLDIGCGGHMRVTHRSHS